MLLLLLLLLLLLATKVTSVEVVGTFCWFDSVGISLGWFNGVGATVGGFAAGGLFAGNTNTKSERVWQFHQKSVNRSNHLL